MQLAKQLEPLAKQIDERLSKKIAKELAQLVKQLAKRLRLILNRINPTCLFQANRQIPIRKNLLMVPIGHIPLNRR